MYTSMQDYEDNRYTKGTDHSPRGAPASGFPSAPPPPLPPPPSVPYMATTGSNRGYRRNNHGAVVAEQWSTNLCHCCDDPANCLVTLFCPCITFGQIAEIVDQGAPGNSCKCGCAGKGAVYGLLAFTGTACLYSCFYRSKLRGQYDLVEAPCVDCLVHFCCEPCALCQEYRELNRRGFDMGIGWEANMDRQKRAVAMVPPVTGHGMTR